MALPLQRSARTVGGSRLPATGRTLLNNVCRDQISRQQRSGTYASSGRNEHGEAHETAAVTKRQLLAGVGALALPAIPAAQPALADSAPGTSSKSTRYYMEVSIDGQKVEGRIVYEVFPDVAPLGARRWAELAAEREGVGYRLSKFDGIYDTYLKNSGVNALSYNAAGRSPIVGGSDSSDALEAEMASPGRLMHDRPGLVSLVVKEANERPVKERLVAYGGKLVTVTEQAGAAPNGTSFVITTGPCPELDGTNLVVGRVVDGLDTVVAAISALPVNKPRTDIASPFFAAGKAMGDKRAVTAEKAFYRPLKRVVVTASGIF